MLWWLMCLTLKRSTYPLLKYFCWMQPPRRRSCVHLYLQVDTSFSSCFKLSQARYPAVTRSEGHFSRSWSWLRSVIVITLLFISGTIVGFLFSVFTGDLGNQSDGSIQWYSYAAMHALIFTDACAAKFLSNIFITQMCLKINPLLF